MADPIKVQIGDETIEVPPILNFAQLERVWPALKIIGSEDDPVANTAAAIAFIAGALLPTRPDLTTAKIKAALKINIVDGTDQRPGLHRAVNQVCIASGLAPQGEATPPAPPAEPAAQTMGNSTLNGSSTGLPAPA